MRYLMRAAAFVMAAVALGTGLTPERAAGAEGARPAPPLQQVPLPYSFHDGNGMQWDIQPDGTIGPGNANVFDAGARLMIGPNIQYTPPTPQAQLDAAQNEIILPPQKMADLNVSRRVMMNSKEGWLRFVEILDNPGATPIKAPVHIGFQLGQPIESAQPIGDGKKQDKTIGLAVFDNQRGIAFLGAGRGSTLVPIFNPQPGGNMVEIAYEDVEIPAHQKVAIVHVEAVRSSRNEAEAFIQRTNERHVLQGLPPELIHRVINFPPQGATIADHEILRGDLLDIVELRGGDQYKGTLKEPKFSLQTPYGPVDLLADRVIAMLSIGDYRPYQLVVTSDGQAFGGALQSPAIHLELSSGQVTPIPLASIARLGYRKRTGEPEEWKSEGTMLVLRAGDRLRAQPPSQPITVSTRYGRLELKPQTIASLGFQSEEQPVHEILLTDGSKFAGLIDADPLHLILTDRPGGGPISFGAAAISRLQLAPAREPDEQTPTLLLSTADRLVGTIGGILTLDTAFDSLKLNGPEVRALAHNGNSPTELQVTMWDGATISGRLQGDELAIALQCGATLKVPVALIDKYAQPMPMPSAAMMQKIEGLLKDLGAEDEARSSRAAEQLKSLGPMIGGGLRAARDKQPQPARERIEKVLAEMDAATKPKILPAPTQIGPVEINAQPQQNQVEQ